MKNEPWSDEHKSYLISYWWYLGRKLIIQELAFSANYNFIAWVLKTGLKSTFWIRVTHAKGFSDLFIVQTLSTRTNICISRNRVLFDVLTVVTATFNKTITLHLLVKFKYIFLFLPHWQFYILIIMLNPTIRNRNRHL